ncbi:EamA family transporter [Staphylococcus aureus]
MSVSTTPIFSSALAYIFLKEHFSKWNWLSSLVAFIGISIISISKDDYTTINVLGVFYYFTHSLVKVCILLSRKNT